MNEEQILEEIKKRKDQLKRLNEFHEASYKLTNEIALCGCIHGFCDIEEKIEFRLKKLRNDLSIMRGE